MSQQTFSVLIRCWHEANQTANRLQITPTDTAQEIFLSDSSFLVRVTIDDQTLVERCYVRHIASGREVYVQSGGGLQDFIRTCVLENSPPPDAAS